MSKVTLLRLDIETHAPWRIAAPETASVIDLPVATDGAGGFFAPATSIAGSLRSHLARSARTPGGPTMAVEMLGSDRPVGGRGEGAPITPSALRILGTSVRVADPGRRQTAQTAMNRHRAAAEAKSLRLGEVLPSGSTVSVYAEYDGELDPVATNALADWVPEIGGGRSIGLGACALTGIAFEVLDLTTAPGLERWLGLDGPPGFSNLQTEITPTGRRRAPLFDIEVEIVDGLRTGAGAEGNRLLMNRIDGEPVIDGSSLKGIFRSRCEFIARSIGCADACDEALSEGGAGATGDGDTAPEPGAIARLFGTRDRRGLIGFEQAVISNAECEFRPHVAVDRFTRGAASGLLFEEEVVVRGRFRIVIRPLVDAVPPWASDLLAQVLRDLDEGWVGIGSGTARGQGTIRIVDRSDWVPPASLAPETLAALGRQS